MKIRHIPQKESCLHTLHPYRTRIIDPFCSIGHRKIKASEIIIQLLNIPNSPVILPTGLEISPPRYEGWRQDRKCLWASFPVHSTCCGSHAWLYCCRPFKRFSSPRMKIILENFGYRTLEWINNSFLAPSVTFLYLPLSFSWNIGQILRG